VRLCNCSRPCLSTNHSLAFLWYSGFDGGCCFPHFSSFFNQRGFVAHFPFKRLGQRTLLKSLFPFFLELTLRFFSFPPPIRGNTENPLWTPLRLPWSRHPVSQRLVENRPKSSIYPRFYPVLPPNRCEGWKPHQPLVSFLFASSFSFYVFVVSKIA